MGLSELQCSFTAATFLKQERRRGKSHSRQLEVSEGEKRVGGEAAEQEEACAWLSRRTHREEGKRNDGPGQAQAWPTLKWPSQSRSLLIFSVGNPFLLKMSKSSSSLVTEKIS